MRIKTLDVAATHVNHPGCKMRLAQDPEGKWYCVDCGHELLWTTVEVEESVDRFEECEWPHYVEGPILVYDRDAFDKYRSGEYEPLTKCVCGEEITYDDDPPSICLVEDGTMTGEAIIGVKVPATLMSSFVVLNLADDVVKASEPNCRTCQYMTTTKGNDYRFWCLHPDAVELRGKVLNCEPDSHVNDGFIVAPPECVKRDLSGVSMGCSVQEPECALCDSNIHRISVTCACANVILNPVIRGEIVTWRCPCGAKYEKSTRELPMLPDEIIIERSLGMSPSHYWSGKDVVGYLLAKGWKIVEGGMSKLADGDLCFIHEDDIIQSGGTPKEEGERLDRCARENVRKAATEEDQDGASEEGAQDE